MSVSTVEEILAWAAQGSIAEITLLGGEPALHADFSRIVALISTSGFRVRTVTNGSPRFRAAMAHGPTAAAMDRVAVSLDAPIAGVFDQLRGPGAFRDAMRAVDLLTEQHKKFDINFTVVKSAIPHVTQMLRFSEQLGARRINMHWFSPVGRGRLNAEHEAVSSDQWRQVVDLAQEYVPSRKDFIVDCELGFELGYRGENLRMCAVRDRTNLQFMPDGNVFSCGMLVERPDLAGYVWRDGSLHLRQAESEVTRTATPCGGCPMRAKVDAVGNDGAPEPLPLCIYNRLDRSPAH
jgi:MoaA/NifB/PqqE/SkfB family radical SAM enzyme